VIDVSVVVPTRNRKQLLAVTLESVLGQLSVGVEVIVVDEASTDGTPEFVATLGDPRITLVRHDEPRGPGAARNHGADRAGGAWIAFVDDDDVWAPEKLARQLAAADDAGAGWAYAGVVNVGPDLSIVSGSPPPTPTFVVGALPRSNPIPGGGSNVVVRRDLLRAAGGFDERLWLCEDWELWARLAQRSAPASAPAPLVGYRVHAVSRSLDVQRILREVALIEGIHGVTVDRGRMHRWFAESYLRLDRRAAAVAEFGRAAIHGDPAGAFGDLAGLAARRARRSLGRDRPSAGGSSDDAWRAAAHGWLHELAAGPPAGPGDRGPHRPTDDDGSTGSMPSDA
jgi:glycosyltransferase involved in cell wall biosynthesis